jgi:hypothetical protein
LGGLLKRKGTGLSLGTFSLWYSSSKSKLIDRTTE